MKHVGQSDHGVDGNSANTGTGLRGTFNLGPTKKWPGALESFILGIDGIVDAAGARLNIGAAEFLLAEILAEPLHDRRPCDEHRRVFCHYRIMAGGKSRRTQTRDDPDARPPDRW